MSDTVQLKDVRVNMNNINLNVIVLDPGCIRPITSGTINTMKVADASGSITLSVMHPEYDDPFAPGDILRIRGAFAGVFQSRLVLNVGNRSGECKKCGEFTMVFSPTPDFSQPVLSPNSGETHRRPRYNLQSPSDIL